MARKRGNVGRVRESVREAVSRCLLGFESLSVVCIR